MIRFRVAHDARKDHTDYINVVAFNKVAEIVASYGKKGNLVTVAGRLTTHRDINNVVYTEILLDNIQLPDRQKTQPGEPERETTAPVAVETEELPW